MSVKETTQNKTIEDLFSVGAHFGYSKSRRHPSVKNFIYGIKKKSEIFDLERTAESLFEALEFVSKLTGEGGVVLFIGGKKESHDAIRDGAMSVKMPYVSGRWIGGTITNFEEIKKRIERLETLREEKTRGDHQKYTKKEQLLLEREINKLEDYFGGLTTMRELPKAILVVDPKREKIAVDEAKRKGIKIIALAGSDCDISEIDYPIPANDSSKKSIEYFVGQIVEAIKESKKS